MAEVPIDGMIVRTPGTVGGRPRIAGTRISVARVAVWHHMGHIPEEIIQDYTHLSLPQVYAALAYYYANKAEIDADIEAEERLYNELAEQQRRERQLT